MSILLLSIIVSSASGIFIELESSTIGSEPKEYTLFFYKNLFYKNVEAEIDPNFKNVLRTFLRLRVD